MLSIQLLMPGPRVVPAVRRRPLALAALALAITVLAAPASAQSVNRALIDRLNRQLLYVALPLTLFVEVTILYAVVRFRNNDDPRPTLEDKPLEITWTVATGLVLIFVGISAYTVLASPYLSPQAPGGAGAAGTGGGGALAAGADPAETAALEVDVVAYQWGWQFHYPVANVTSRNVLVVPVERNVSLRLTSADVIHSLYVPALGLKQDMFPGQTTRLRTYVTERGAYRAHCAQLCGAGHARMEGVVRAVDRTTFERWRANATAGGPVTAPAGD